MKWESQIELHRNSRDWKMILSVFGHALSDTPDDVRLNVHAAYSYWEILMENFPAEVSDLELVQKLFAYHIRHSYKRFVGDANYLFFISILCTWYEWLDVDSRSLSKEMIIKAREIDNNNILYEWAALGTSKIAQDRERRRFIAKKILEKNSKERIFLESWGYPGQYLLNVLLPASARDDG